MMADAFTFAAPFALIAVVWLLEDIKNLLRELLKETRS